jgi:hypothetical protein
MTSQSKVRFGYGYDDDEIIRSGCDSREWVIRLDAVIRPIPCTCGPRCARCGGDNCGPELCVLCEAEP